MIAAGCDIGALTVKAAVIKDGALAGTEMIRSRAKASDSADEVTGKLLKRLGLSRGDIDCFVSTGYGRNTIPFADGDVSEISCHGRGAVWLVPAIRTVIDGGGQDFKAIRVNEKGAIEAFQMNMRCAAGTGRALEIMAESLGVDVGELGPLSLKATEPVALRNYCCIIAEIKIRHLIMEGKSPEDIAAGINDLTARRILGLLKNVGPRNEIAFTGGVAKNTGIVRFLEKALETKLAGFPIDPQLVGAVGAAVLAQERLTG